MSCRIAENSAGWAEKLTGIFAPVCTPFAPDEEIDYDALRFNIAYYATTPLRGYLALGSNGENRSLTEKEKLEVLTAIIESKGSEQVVMAGATYDAKRDTDCFFRHAAALGTDFGLVLPPSYFRKQMTDAILEGYFRDVADCSPIPILLYNAPGFCGITLSPDLVACLSEHPNIVGMKDSAPNGIENFLRYQGEKFHVLAGSANTLLPAMLGGAPGGTVSLANSFPQIALSLFEFGRKRDRVHGAELQAHVTRINNRISGAYGPAGVKAAMNLAGLRGGIPRRPLLPLSPEETVNLRRFLIEEGLLSQ